MKTKNISLALAAVFVSNASAQFAMTNTATGELSDRGYGELAGAMRRISFIFDVRICAEDATQRLETPFAFTNATLAHVFGTIMARQSNHVWRYESKTMAAPKIMFTTQFFPEIRYESRAVPKMPVGSIYVYPEEDAVSMLMCPPISVTNAVVRTLFAGDDVFGLNERGIRISPSYTRGNTSWADARISFEIGEAPLWRVLDAVFDQIPRHPFAVEQGLRAAWALQKRQPGAGGLYYMFFY